MNHDITHCTGEDVTLRPETKQVICPKREICHRYKAHLEAPKNTTLSYLVPLDCITNGFKDYWEG